MDQTHIGYTYWQQPVRNAMPAVQEIQVPAPAEMGVSIEGSEASWPESPRDACLTSSGGCKLRASTSKGKAARQ